MEKVLEQPGPKNWNWALWEPPLRPPSMLLNHTHLLKSPLLPEMLIHESEAGYSTPFAARTILLTKALPGYLDLTANCISQAAKVSWDCLEGECCVWFSSSTPCYHVERRHHNLHLMIVLLVSSINLQQRASYSSPRDKIDSLSRMHMKML